MESPYLVQILAQSLTVYTFFGKHYLTFFDKGIKEII